MRRTSSEIIRGLESRIAKLERQSSNIRKAYRDSIEDNFNPDKSVISFALGFDILSWQSDPNSTEQDESEEAEKRALKSLNRILGVKAQIYSRDGMGTANACFRVKSLTSLVDLVKKINRLKIKDTRGFETTYNVVSDEDFYFATAFLLIPEGLNNSWPDECYMLDKTMGRYKDLETELMDSGLL